jgi:hypothetical protein
MEAATRLACDYWHDKFYAATQAEEAQKRARIAERKQSETLYRIAPDREPELIDEGIGYRATARNENELAWAERRLVDLGFQIICEERIKSYTSEHEDFVVYADPRANGEITFRAYKKPLPRQSRVRRIRTGAFNFFRLMDSWKNDIRGKYQTRLAKAIGI